MTGLVFQYMIGLLCLFAHPYYVSMTEIEHNKKDNSLEISVRIFTDDFEKAIRKAYTGKVDLLNASEKSNSEKLIQQYVAAHLSITANGKNLKMNFVGFESQEGSIWSYFECSGITSLQKIEITNSILYDYQKLEINFIHVKAGAYNETRKLDYPDTYERFVLK